MAGDTSCSRAASATARRESSMLGISMTASGFSGAANVLTSPISPQWATGGTAPRGASRSYALASIGAHTAPCRSNREACISGRTSVFLGCLPITRPCESRGRVMLDSTNHASIVSIYGGNAEADLLASVVGQFVDGLAAGCFWPKADIPSCCSCPLSGVKRTCPFASHMSAFDPKPDMGGPSPI